MIRTISSDQNPLIKHLVKIRDNPFYREKHGSLLIAGRVLIEELLNIVTPKRIFFTELDLKPPKQTELFQITLPLLKKITNLPSPEGIVAEFPLPSPNSLEKLSLILALDRISDPGNIGTLIRSAVALGWHGIFFLPGCVDPFHEKAIRASRCGLFYIEWKIGSWSDLQKVKEKNKSTAYIADLRGTPINTVKQDKNILLVMSSESQGVSPESKQFGEAITIPMSKKMESLNVATAGAILMFALRNG